MIEWIGLHIKGDYETRFTQVIKKKKFSERATQGLLEAAKNEDGKCKIGPKVTVLK